MKKIIALLLALVMVFALVACGGTKAPEADTNTETGADANTDAAAGESVEGEVAGDAAEEDAVEEVVVMTHDEYIAAELDTQVVVETYVQAKQGWWEKDGVGVATIYTQDKEGAYFIYEMPISQDDYNKLTAGTKIKVKGFKGEWAGEVEIMDGTFEILDGNWVATATEANAWLGTDELIKHQNEFVSFKGATIVASTDANGAEAAFLYNWDGSGSQGNDVYFNAKIGENVYTFTIESYLTGADTEVYKAAEALAIGDVIDMEGFLYWYDGPNPHITKITKVQ